MGYETLCYALYDLRDLVEAISARLLEIHRRVLARILEFDRVKVIWGSDDMGFRGGTLVSPPDMRQFVLPEHKLMARMTHDAGRPYILHACGNLRPIMEDLIEEVGIDGRHSFEDVIEPVEEAYATYGERISILGGIDVDFLCRADEGRIRERVRRVLEQTMPAGGYCLGSGNSIPNYMPLDHFLAMVDEGRRFGA
jgi:uroporphyrinogen decarboxylase